jgi:predicted HicB family RNase H-like nuclease
VQARVPGSLYARIEKAAKAELISMAAYVRRTLQNHVPGG